MATVNNLQIDQGSPFKRSFLVMDGTSPKDLTGCTARMQFRTSYPSDVVRLEATTENGLLSISTVNSLVSVKLKAANTAALTGSYVYDIYIYDPSGEPQRIVEGCVTIRPEVTRTT